MNQVHAVVAATLVRYAVFSGPKNLDDVEGCFNFLHTSCPLLLLHLLLIIVDHYLDILYYDSTEAPES